MLQRRKIALLLWAGPGYVLAIFAFHVALESLSPPGLFALVDMRPLIYGALALPPALLLITTACGIWFSLRALGGRSTPIGAFRRIPLDRMHLRADEILPLVAGLTVALPALAFFIPIFFAFPTANQFHIVQAPSVFSAWFVAWAVWSMPVSRFMKGYQLLTPFLMLTYVLLRDVGADNQFVGVWAQLFSFAWLLWLVITPIWLASVMRSKCSETLGAARL